MSFELIKEGKQPQKVVVLPDSVYHSYLGEYFLGQTNTINFSRGYHAWGSLINPEDSNVNMFLNAYTISNYSNQPLTVEGWLSSELPGYAEVSTHFAVGNQSIIPSPLPKVLIESASYVSTIPTGGTYTFVRRVEPNLTLTKHDFQGFYIIPPGSNFALFFISPGMEPIQARVAFGWWEEKLDKLDVCYENNY